MRDMWLERWVQRQFDNLGPWLRRRKQAMADWLDFDPVRDRAESVDLLIPGAIPDELARLNDADGAEKQPHVVIGFDRPVPVGDWEKSHVIVERVDQAWQQAGDSWPGYIAPGQHPWTVRLPDITPAQEAEAAAVAERVIDNLRGEAARADADRRRRFTEGGDA